MIGPGGGSKALSRHLRKEGNRRELDDNREGNEPTNWGAERHDHELLEIDVVVGMPTAVKLGHACPGLRLGEAVFSIADRCDDASALSWIIATRSLVHGQRDCIIPGKTTADIRVVPCGRVH